ncbi:MAG: hypothetical protein K0S26_1136 [Bacteroidota bacterium]|jgi:hypothetical protein|nr:hypothetical protein [Bacteroidota bacterium]
MKNNNTIKIELIGYIYIYNYLKNGCNLQPGKGN